MPPIRPVTKVYIETSPDPEVVIGSQPFFSTYRVLDEADAVRVITGYEQRNWLIAPIISA